MDVLGVPARPSHQGRVSSRGKATSPLIVGVAPFGFLFGVLALAAGLPWWVPVGMSTIVFAGSAQFVAILLFTAGRPFPLIILTTIRAQFATCPLWGFSGRLPKTTVGKMRALLSFGMTDESYAVAITRYRDSAEGDPANKHWFFLGANMTVYVPWLISTVAGYLIGNALGDPLALGLDFALPVVFIAILVPQLRSRSRVLAALCSGLVAVLAIGLPNKLGLLVSIVAGILIVWCLRNGTSHADRRYGGRDFSYAFSHDRVGGSVAGALAGARGLDYVPIALLRRSLCRSL